MLVLLNRPASTRGLARLPNVRKPGAVDMETAGVRGPQQRPLSDVRGHRVRRPRKPGRQRPIVPQQQQPVLGPGQPGQLPVHLDQQPDTWKILQRFGAGNWFFNHFCNLFDI